MVSSLLGSMPYPRLVNIVLYRRVVKRSECFPIRLARA